MFNHIAQIWGGERRGGEGGGLKELVCCSESEIYGLFHLTLLHTSQNMILIEWGLVSGQISVSQSMTN